MCAHSTNRYWHYDLLYSHIAMQINHVITEEGKQLTYKIPCKITVYYVTVWALA